MMFSECQGCKAQENISCQDNKSVILLEKNGCASASKRTRAVNVRHFQTKDHIDENQLDVKCCRTDDMTGDYVTKRLQGCKFSKFRKAIVGMEWFLRRSETFSKTNLGKCACVFVCACQIYSHVTWINIQQRKKRNLKHEDHRIHIARKDKLAT